MRKDLTDDAVKQAAQTAASMKRAAELLGVPYRTFIVRAQKLGVYKPNPSGKGLTNTKRGLKLTIPLSVILNGDFDYKGSSQVIKRRMIAAGLKTDQCELCTQLPEHNGLPLVLQLDHIDGNHSNWKLENLRVLCPNCHTQTPTHSGKKSQSRQHRHLKTVSVDEILNAINTTTCITDAARFLNLNPKSSSVRALLKKYFARVA